MTTDQAASEAGTVPRRPDADPAAVTALLRRAFGDSVPVTFERTPDGMSTQVYRVRRGTDTFYLRMAEERDEHLGTDAELHRRLRMAGVQVPAIVFVEEFDAALDRSVLITDEVPGATLADGATPETARALVRQAGAQLAVLNGLPVDGFGWVHRHGPGWPLRAEHRRYADFVTSEMPANWPGPLAALFSSADLDRLAALAESERRRTLPGARLAHGDFDAMPIFHRDGRYTGLIDFGEIRGTEPEFDLGHFLLHDTEHVPMPLLPALLDGYRQVRPPPDHAALCRSAILSGLRQLCRWIAPDRAMPPTHPAVVARTHRLTELLAAG